MKYLEWLGIIAAADLGLLAVFVLIGELELWQHRRRLWKKNLPPIRRAPARN
jgi:hypothetical protein